MPEKVGLALFALSVLRVVICDCASEVKLAMYANLVLFTVPLPTRFAESLALLVIASCLRANAVLVAVDTGLFASDVLSTFANPTVVLDSPFTVAPVKSTVPLNVGEDLRAYDEKELAKAYDDKLLVKA